MRFCPSCGGSVNSENRFCQHCGAELRDSESIDDSSGSKPDGDDASGTADEDPDQAAHAGRDAYDPSAGGILSWSIEYPAKPGLGPTLIGGILLLFFFLIVPLFIAIGYWIRTTAAAAAGDPEPPGFDRWGGMLKDGLVFAIVILLIVAIMAGLTVGLQLLSEVTNSPIPFIPAIILWIAAYYAGPAIYVNYAVHRRVAAAFDLPAIFGMVTSTTYLIGWFHYLIMINFLGAIVVYTLMALSILTIVGWIIIIPMLYFYWVSIDAALWGRVYYKQTH